MTKADTKGGEELWVSLGLLYVYLVVCSLQAEVSSVTPSHQLLSSCFQRRFDWDRISAFYGHHFMIGASGHTSKAGEVIKPQQCTHAYTLTEEAHFETH